MRADEVRPARRQPPVMAVDDVRPVLIGTLIWGLLLVAALLDRTDLQASGRGWWIWTALAGVGLGVVGTAFLLRRRRRIDARQGPADS